VIFIHEPAVGGGATAADEAILTLPDKLTSGTAINIQTGVYAGGGPATITGSTTLTIPVAFDTDALIQVLVNGKEQYKGAAKDVFRSSSTQLTFNDDVKKDGIVKVRISS